MTTLREAAQQALEALEDMLGWQSLAPQTIQESAKGRAAALRSALAEPVQEPKPVAYIDALKDAFFEGFTSVATYNDMLLNSPEEAWEKYKPPRITPPQRPAEPVQEPVAWIEHEWAGTGLRKLHFEKRDPTVRDEVVNPVWTPLYTAPPPQRKPLTEAEIDEVWNSLIATPDFSRVKIARAIERAHKIGGEE